jgi:hypothetical protein
MTQYVLAGNVGALDIATDQNEVKNHDQKIVTSAMTPLQ